MWRNIATMIYGWHEQIQPGGAGGVYTLVFATLCCQDTVRIMPYSFSMPNETVATRRLRHLNIFAYARLLPSYKLT